MYVCICIYLDIQARRSPRTVRVAVGSASQRGRLARAERHAAVARVRDAHLALLPLRAREQHARRRPPLRGAARSSELLRARHDAQPRAGAPELPAVREVQLELAVGRAHVREHAPHLGVGGGAAAPLVDEAVEHLGLRRGGQAEQLGHVERAIGLGGGGGLRVEHVLE
jgi:hypothetical protein